MNILLCSSHSMGRQFLSMSRESLSGQSPVPIDLTRLCEKSSRNGQQSRFARKILPDIRDLGDFPTPRTKDKESALIP